VRDLETVWAEVEDVAWAVEEALDRHLGHPPGCKRIKFRINDPNAKSNQRNKWNNAIVHILLWGVIFFLPYFFMDSERFFNWRLFIRSLPDLLGFMFVFYINYFLLIEKLLFKGKTKQFILYNLLLIVGTAFLMHYSHGWMTALLPDMMPRWPMRRRAIPLPFVVRNFTSLFFMTGLSLALKMTIRWLEVDNERKELAKAKSEAELKTLKIKLTRISC